MPLSLPGLQGSYGPENFSLRVGWHAPGRGHYPRVDIPGYYLDASFANEGEADRIVQDYLLTPAQFDSILKHIATEIGAVGHAQQPYLGQVGEHLKDASTSTLRASLSAAEGAEIAARERAKLLRAALSDVESR